ncbi:hypothetical protein [Brucella intermedia]|uniref:hypothetical protein n=1 Tax=Brucella TaxID=234 RepID=UPI00110FE61C|nr:hypothetical protein [Brucella intermedia]NKB96828.1 hypothetical protein [Brucella intermedia]
MFARLLALSAIQEARIKANPVPYLDKLAAENHRLRSAIEKAIIHLSGASSYDLARDIAPQLPPSIVETTIERNRRAEKILVSAMRGDA